MQHRRLASRALVCLLLAGGPVTTSHWLAPVSAAAAAEMTLVETGSTLMFPLIQSWSQAYGKVAPDLHMHPSSTGSGAGISSAIDGTAQLGASDAYMSDLQMLQHPGILNIPLAIAAQTVNYNLPGVSAPLRLSGPVLSAIYGGRVREWDDQQVAALNPGVSLPHQPIVPIRRSDAAGDTFIFTQFLTFSTPSWESGPGYGTTVEWPDVPGTISAAGNSGMVQALAKTPYGIAYIGTSFLAAVTEAKLGTAMLENDAGRFVLPTSETVTAAAAALTPKTPADQRLTLAFAPGEKAYPLVSYEYALVRSQQQNPEQATALRDFLTWAVTPGKGSDAAFLDPVAFIALPTGIRALSESQIAKIH